MRQNWLIVGGSVGWIALIYGGYTVVYDNIPGGIPDWASIGAVFTVIAAGLVAIGRWDRRRWGRALRSLQFEPVTEETRIDGVASSAFHGRIRGRDVYVGYNSAVGSTVNDESTVIARHDAEVETDLVIQRLGAGGTGGSDLPPSIDVDGDAFSEDFRGYTRDTGYGMAVLTPDVQQAIIAVPDVKEIRVESDRVTLTHIDQLPSKGVMDSLVTAACQVAEAVEAACPS